MKRTQHAVNEVHVLCRLNETRYYAPILGETYGWVMCHSLPKEWLERIGDNFGNAELLKNAVDKKTHDFVFIAMELNSHKLDQLQYVEEDLIMAFFLLLHGIAQLRRTFSHFRHRDIHRNNIMIKLLPPIEQANPWDAITVHVANKHKVVFKNITRMPRLIDFGEARFSSKSAPFDDDTQWNNDFFDDKGHKFARRNDLYRIAHVIIRWAYNALKFDDANLLAFIYSKEYQDAMYGPIDQYEPIEHALGHQYFKIPNISWVPIKNVHIKNYD